MSLLVILVVLAVAAAGYGTLHYMTSVPGKPHRGPLPPITSEEAELGQSLKQHIAAIAEREHNVTHYDELEKVARYIETTLASIGYAVGRQEFFADGKPVRNIDVTIEPAGRSADPEVIVIGAHYDSVFGSPGANDNGSGVAAVIELARLLRDLDGVGAKRIRLALFVNEEPPYFMTEAMGRPDVSRSRRLHRVCGDDGLARARAGDDAIIPLAYVLSHHRRSGARFRSRHRLVGSLGLCAAGLSSRDDHRHGAVPLSPLPPAQRHSG